MRIPRPLLAPFAVALMGATSPPEAVSFIACPVAQETGPSTDLCFFAEHDGKRFSLNVPADWGAPQLGHRVLVEGEVTGAPLRCGGLVLEGRISVLSEVATECNRIAPFNGVADASTPTEAAQARARLIAELVQASLTDPVRSLDAVPLVMTPLPAVRPGQVETLYLPFNSLRYTGPDAERLVALARLAAGSRDVVVSIHASAGDALLADGTVLREDADMAEQRARKTSDTLAGLGVPLDRIKVAATPPRSRPTGKRDWQQRRVEVVVERSPSR